RDLTVTGVQTCALPISGSEAAAPLEGHKAWVGSLAISPDGLWMASGCGDGTVIVWNVSSRALERTLVGHSAPVHSVAFSPDGRRSEEHTSELQSQSNLV